MKEQIYEIKPEEVIVPEGRHRKVFEAGAMVRLCCSLRRYGQFTPAICEKNQEGQVVLIQGERRLRACADEGLLFKYILKEEITDPLLREELELEENVQREDLTWQEKCLAEERLRVLRQKRYGASVPGREGGYTMQDHADALGTTKGLISQDSELAHFLIHSEEVAHAKNKTEAKKIVKRIKDAVTRSRTLKVALEEKEEPSEARLVDEPSKPVLDSSDSVLRNQLARMARRSVLGLFEDKINSFKDESIDVVIFDPPWGVALDEVSAGKEHTGHTKSFEDDESILLEKFPKWLEVLYAKLKQDSHFYLFFGIIHHSFVYDQLEACGFTVNRMPLFWYKQGAHVTRNPEVWPGRCYEAIAYGRKGNKRLAKLGKPDIIPTPIPTPKMKKEHPSAKHPDVYIELLQRSASPGDAVLDPMSGSGMFGVACEYLAPSLSLDWWMIEKEKSYRDLGLFNILTGYANIITPPKEPKPKPEEKYEAWGDELAKGQEGRLAGGYKALEPGTPDWMAYWKAHPEHQEGMATWAKFRKEESNGTS